MKIMVRHAMASGLVVLGLVTASPLGVLGDTGQRNSGTSQTTPQGAEHVQKAVLHELRMLPYYSVFDDLQFKVVGDQVVLSGQVRLPVLKSDAESAVKRVEGVKGVINNIEVLPLSNFDDRIRLAEYRAIYRQPGMERYAIQAIGPIHIIVKNGNVTLTGVVANMLDKNLAGIRAHGVGGVFSVKNKLRLDG